MVSERGFEPPHLTALAPKASVSTVPPLGQEVYDKASLLALQKLYETCFKAFTSTVFDTLTQYHEINVSILVLSNIYLTFL